jgi:general secretion pathway protein K
MNRQRGFALLIVLWTMGLLALLVAQFTATGRREVQMAANLRANAVTQAAADGAVHEAILRLLQSKWVPDGREHAIRVGTADVAVRIKDEEWKVNPNDVKLPALQALLAHLGVEAAKGTALAHAIIDWHTIGAAPRPVGPRPTRNRGAGATPPAGNRLFDSLDEVGLVIGMTPALLARMKPFLSIYQEGDVFEADDSAPPRFDGAARIGSDGWHLGSTGRTMLVMIEATAIGMRGGRFTREAVVRLRAEASLDQSPYQILTWDTPSE